MARIFCSGIEENGLTSSGWSAVVGAGTTIDTGTKHSGTASLKIAPTTNTNTNVRKDTTSKTSGTVYTRRYYNLTSAGTAIDPTIFETRSSGNVQSMIIRQMRGGELKLQNVVATTEASTATVLTAGLWYRIETRHLLSDTVGEMELRLYLGDSTTALDTLLLDGVGHAGEDTLATNNASYYFGQQTNPHTTCVFYMDDIVIQDETGTINLSWPGPGKFYLVTAASDTTVAWTKDGSAAEATNFAGVDDVPTLTLPDDATTYNSSTSTSDEDKFALTATHAEVPSNATMMFMDVYARISAPDAILGSQAMKVWNDLGTGTQGPTISTASATWRILSQTEHQVVDLTGKTQTEVASYSIGYKALSGASRKAVTGIWANVEWLESSGASAAQMAPAFQYPGAMIGRRYV